MIVDNLTNITKYSSIIPKKVIDFLRNIHKDLIPGRYEIDEKCYANIDEYEPKHFENCKFEAHKKYIDIQMVLEGEERIDITDVSNLKISEQYDKNKDVMFFENSDNNIDKIDLKPFKFVFIHPSEAHKPQIKTHSDYIKKVVVKIATH